MIVAGFGFRAAASMASLQDALAAAGGARVSALATADDKAATPAFRAFAAALGLPVLTVDAAAIAAQPPTATRSAAALATRGTGSLAEAAALAAAGPNAQLLTPRVISQDRMASCALAEKEDTP